MAEYRSIHKINSLRQRWISYRVLNALMLSAAIALLLGTFCHYLFGAEKWWILIWFVVIGAILFIRKPWDLSNESVSSFLNSTYPELEESAELSLKSGDELSLLQRFQLEKVELALDAVPTSPRELTRPLGRTFILLGLAIAVSVVFAKFPPRASGSLFTAIKNGTNSAKPEKILPQISSVNLIINPPAYTGKTSREQEKFTILAEEGASAKWKLKTNMAVNAVSLLFNEHEKIGLKPNANKTEWAAEKLIDKPGFYQVNIDGKLSDLYQVETIKDNLPVIQVKSPKQYTYIDAGEIPKVTLTSTVSDDYGIANAMVYATVAKGSGEAVKFKEYKLDFGTSFQGHNKQYDLQKLFDLPKFDMEPGDELYLYIEAQDTHQQKSRTDVYTITMQDTAQLMSMNGIVNGSNLRPEFFRSERQIIMDTEHLLKIKDSLNNVDFKGRCNDIGIDQKLLRLRYGKFLGEEEESSVGQADASAQAELSKLENFNNAQMMIDAITDKHDNEEDATFLEPAVKAQLRATLTEMWQAELQLRTFNPQAALPFEYKALRLLKDLQQKSRAYVAKTAYNPAPLKPEKRLSGDLSKITDPVNKQDVKLTADEYAALKNAVQLLEQIKISKTYPDAGRHALQLAKQQLSVKASGEPGIYLSAVTAITRILDNASSINTHDVDLVEKAIQRALPAGKQLPQSTGNKADMGLSNAYYQNLSRH